MSIWHYLSVFAQQSNREVAVVVPVYKKEMTRYEQISFERCVDVFNHYEIVLVGPEGLNIDKYLETSSKLRICRFERKFFESTQGYNKLMLSKKFYDKFVDYKYILIHQLDAFVFKDDLSKWCSMRFDYIGSPWIGVDWPKSQHLRRNLPIWIRKQRLRQLIGDRAKPVGNGGFSLRKVRSFIFMLLLFRSIANQWIENEDAFWAIAAPNCLPFFKVPSVELALKFSFELQPRLCFERNGNNLPFGCHAWWTYDIEFWRPIFSRHGYEI